MRLFRRPGAPYLRATAIVSIGHGRLVSLTTPVTDLLESLRAQLGDRYRIDRELGGGGMSRVFLAEEIALGRRVVLKVLPPELAPVLSVARFEREVRVAARLQHPHIVPLLTAGEAGEVLFYTMPLVEGESLRARLDQQRELPVVEALRLLREIADALVYAHREGVVHRDIKPDNILLSHAHAMVTDFGIARAVSEAVSGGTLTQTGMAVGTPAYMSPEQAAGESNIDHRADLYALGVVAYEMLAGHPPFRGATYQALVAAHLTHTPAPLTEARPSVPPELAAVVHRCLEKRAADRYQDAAEVVAALAAVPMMPAGATRPIATAPVALSRRAWLAGVAALGALGAAFGSGVMLAARTRRGASVAYQRLTFRRGLIRSARFGPDGHTVLYGALWEGDVCRAYTVRPESPESSPLPLPPAAPLAVSASGELALSLGTHYRGIMTYGTLARVPIAGGAPRELQEEVKYADWSPDGRELAVVRRVGDHDVLEYPVGTVIATPEEPGGGFSFPRVSPDGDAVAAFELVASGWLVGRVVIVDRSGVKRTVSARYFNVFGLAWREDEVWFTAAEALPLFRNTLYAMRRSGEVRTIARVPGNTSLHDVAPDGRVLIARTDDRSGIAVRVPGAEGERDLSWLDASNLGDISADGMRVLFTEAGVGGGPRLATYLRGTDGSPAVRLGEGFARALSPDGRWAIAQPQDGARHLDVLPTGAGEARRISREGLKLTHARWLANGREVVVRAETASGAARLHVLDVEGSATRVLTPEDVAIGESGWAVSPDGTMVAVSTDEGPRLWPIAGGAVRDLTGMAAGMRVVAWIEGGLLVSERPEAGGEVFLLDLQSGRRSSWVNIRPQDPAGIMNTDLGTMVVTPDGRGYGYTWHRATSDLYLVEGWS